MPISVNRNQIIPICFQHKWFNDWRIVSRQAQVEQPCWKAWLKQKQNLEAKRFESTLTKYVLPASMANGRSIADFLARPLNQSAQILSWRLNHFSKRKKCSVCRLQFSRKHILSCRLVDDLPIALADRLDARMIQDKRKLNQANISLPFYSLVDCCINNKLYWEFSFLVDFLGSKLD